MDLSRETADGARNRLVLKIVLGLVAAGITIGLLMGIAGASAMRALGFKADDAPAEPAASSPTTTPSAPDTEPTTPAPTAPSATPEATPKPKKEPAFRASSSRVRPGERIEFRGRAPGLGAGATLTIQRKGDGGGWSDFPVRLETRKGGTFSTWIVTSRSGRWDFRAVGDGFSSPSATVEIG
ncbi:hypothetical protein [Mumia sp.]|uniref:hypothetical protein n=1 Tax=Mumia sp. TaxID=1965300 RepID=UPI00261ED9AF|nr:hypothetical protein [Mumia sp.]MDD9348053.1 hypothetical protein [Mumia sp.]